MAVVLATLKDKVDALHYSQNSDGNTNSDEPEEEEDNLC